MFLQCFHFYRRIASSITVLLVACSIGIAAAIPAAAMDFPVSDLSQWKITGTNSKKLKASIDGNGTLILRWPGGAGEAVIEHAKSALAKPYLQDGFLRYISLVNILDDDYGAEFSVQLQPIHENGKRQPPYFARPPHYGAKGQVRGSVGSNTQLYAAPNEWARIDFNYKPTAGITAVKPRFVLRGNAITVAISKSTIETGLTWERGRTPAQPEPRDFDEVHVNQILSQRQQAQPRLIRHPGRVALEVDGQDILPACYTRGLYYPQYTRYGEFSKAGYNLVRIAAFFNPLSPAHKAGVGNMWKAKDTFDFSSLEHELKVIANINPKALVIISANIMPYHDWADENPNSIVTNEKGEKLVVYGGESLQYGGQPDHTNNREAGYAPSFYGGQFPSDAANAVKQLAEFLQTSPVGKIVIGVDFMGGTDGQLYPWDRDRARGADYSPAGLEGWRGFLRKRYGSDISRLQTAWKKSDVTFDNASVATLIDRGYGRSTLVTQQGIDYNDFLSDAMADFILGLGKSLKEGSNNRLLAGVYYSDSGWQGVISHGAMGRIANSSYIDMIRSVLIYQTSGSWWQHGKLTWAEFDMRPPMPNPMQYYTAGLGYTQEQFKTLTWRNAVMALTDLKGGFYPFDMAESWFQDPELVRIFGEVREGLQSSLDDTVNVPPTIGVFNDERVPFRLTGTLGHQLTRTSMLGLYRALDSSSVPYARYLLDDALDPTFELPKICILRLPMAITPDQAKALQEKARRSGSVLIWGYAPGAVAEGTPSSKLLTGFDAQPSGKLTRRQIIMRDEGTLTKGLAGKFLGAPPAPISFNENQRWHGQPYVIQPEAGDRVLGIYDGTDQAGAVLRSRDGLTQIILGMPGAISPQFIRNLAKSLGETPFSEANDEMRFGSGILSFYADKGGPRTITLPVGMIATASPTGHQFQTTENGFTFNIGYSDVAVFKISKVH